MNNNNDKQLTIQPNVQVMPADGVFCQLNESYDKFRQMIDGAIKIPNEEFPEGREVEIFVEFTVSPSKFKAIIRR